MDGTSDSAVDGLGAAERPLIAAARAQFEALAPRHAPPSTDGRQSFAVPGYRILREIHRGGQGVVYQALHLSTHRKVAIKILKEGPFADQTELARLDREVDVLGRLKHPHIVAIHDRGLAAGHAYFVMDFIPGRPLDAYVTRAALSTREVLDLCRKICEAVNVAHLRGVIHRDLKPNNIYIDDEGQPHVLDFGLAKLAGEASSSAGAMTMTGQFIGSLPWASPEQAAGRSDLLDVRTDVYSLGVILYRLLAGRFPYPVTGRMDDVVRNIVNTSPARPSTPGRRIDRDVEVILLKALDKDPERRYQSAGELARDVRHYLANEPVSATYPSAGYRIRKFVRRHWVAVAVAATFLLVLLASSAVAWGLYAAAEHARRVATDQSSQATGRLWESLLSQARAGRSSMRPGRRFESLEAIRRAAAIRPSPELRDEAIACMTLPDIVPVKTFSDVPNASAHGLRDPDRFAYASSTGEIRVVAVEDGRELQRLEARGHRLLRLSFSPDGRYLLAAYVVKHPHFLVDVWDLLSGTALLALDTAAVDPKSAFSPTGEWIALRESDHVVHFYRLPSGDEFKALSFGPDVNQLQAHPSGELMAVSAFEPPYVRVWDIVNDRLVAGLDMPVMAGHLDWSQDGRLLAAGGGSTEDWRIFVWDVERNELRSELTGHQSMATFVHFHPQAELLASRSWDYTSRFWDLRAGREVLGPLQGWFVQGFGDLFACSGEHDRFAIWRFEPARELRRLWAPFPLRHAGAVHFAPDGELLISATKNGVLLWDFATGEYLASLSQQEAVWAEILSDQHTILAATTEGLVRWSILDYGETVQVSESALLWPQEGIQGCCLNPRDRTAIVALPTDLVFFDLATRREHRRLPGFSGMRRPAVSPDGRWVFVGNWKGSSARLWDTWSGEIVQEFPGESVTGCFSPDGLWLIVANGPEFLQCEVGSWNVSRRIQRSHPETVAGLAAFSNDGTMAALAYSQYTIRLIELATGEVLATLPNPDLHALSDLRFSPDDRWLAAATVDRVIEAWDLQRLREGLRTIGLDW